MIELAIYDHLRNYTTGDTSDVVRQTARQRFIHLAGNVVYLGRIPEDAGPVAVCIRRVDGGEQYQILGEHTSSQPTIEFLIVGTDPYGKSVLEVADNLRLIFSGYRGNIGQHYCSGAMVESSFNLQPSPFGDGSDKWVHVFSISIQFTVDQTVPGY